MRQIRCFVFIGCVVFGVACVPPAHGQMALLAGGASPQVPPAEDVTTVTLTIAPQSEPTPALRYRLLPSHGELKPGNAVPFYYRAILELKALPAEVQREYAEKYETWLAWPLDESRRGEIQKWVDYHRAALDELRTAVHREDCEWDYQLDQLRLTAVINFRLEDAQQMRTLARVLQLKARLEMTAGRLDDALETLRTGYRMARDVAKPPLLISSLVGIAVASMMHGELEHLLEAPNAPNLYWALSALPQPLVPIRESLDFESRMPEQVFPLLKDADTAQRSADEWQRLLEESFQSLQAVGGGGEPQPVDWKSRLAISAWLAVGYPLAKEELLKAGYTREAVEAMPVAQVVAIHTSRTHSAARDELFKWSYLPYAQAVERLNEAEQQITKSPPRGTLPITSLLLPAVRSCMVAELRLQRRTALLRTIEALRMHAAQHAAQLPSSLDEITAVPVPLDPFDGRPFKYQRDGERATLEMTTLPGYPATGEARRFVLQIRK